MSNLSCKNSNIKLKKKNLAKDIVSTYTKRNYIAFEKSMKKLITSLALVSTLTLTLTGCSSTPKTTTPGQMKVVTSFYPLYEIASQIGGANISVKNLTPSGVEPHDYEPTPRDIIDMREANLVIYNGQNLEPWSSKIIPDLEKNGTATIEITTILKNSLQGQDPHLWLDPINYKAEVQAVSEKLITLDPPHKTTYEQNTKKFEQQLTDLDTSYKNGLQSCKLNTFITNHAAFAYLAQRYNLTMMPIAGLSPDDEPSAKTMADITNLIKQKNIKYILTESLISPKIADTLAAETGATTLILNPVEGLTITEISQGKNYISVMQDNLKNLRTALECK